MKATVVVYALVLLGLASLVARAQAQQLLGEGALMDVDENDLSARTAAVLDTTRDALSPSDQALLQEMLQESEGVQLVDEFGDSLEDEVEAEADAFTEEAIEDADEEADEDESEEEADSDEENYVAAEEIPGTAHAVAVADEDAEDSTVVEAEDLNEDAEEDEAITDEDLDEISQEGEAAATGADAEDESAVEADADADAEETAFLQLAEQEDVEAEDEDEDEAESDDEESDEEGEDSEDEDEQEAEEEGEALVESASASILSVPEAELHHELMQIQEPALTFLQVVEELDLNTEAESESDSEDEGEISDSADTDDEGEGWGEETSDTDPYALAETESETEELMYNADEAGTMVNAPINAVTSTSETAAQIHAELDEAANLDSSSELSVDTDAALAHAASAEGEAEAEADTDTSEEMEVDTYGEGVWQDVQADKTATTKDKNGKLVKKLPDQPSAGYEALSKDTAAEQNAEKNTRGWAVTKPAAPVPKSVWGQWNQQLLMPHAPYNDA